MVFAAACTDDGPESVGDELMEPQVPARGTADAKAWLAAGYYQAWHCEASAHAGRPPSPHGKNRICNNDALHATAGAGFPVGAASVKEIYDGDTVTGYAISRKVAEGDGGDHWYEATKEKVYANGEGAENCTGCHAGAPRDFVFTIVL